MALQPGNYIIHKYGQEMLVELVYPDGKVAVFWRAISGLVQRTTFTKAQTLTDFRQPLPDQTLVGGAPETS